ncbi:MAG TPA: DUF3574 domain-containing protein [Tepidisphaeraceae bacterium]|nr:DUF3574 domain-containing protein [Tepidisphaeraceae bacterium]
MLRPLLICALLLLPACRATDADIWTRTELYFGLKKPGGALVTESDFKRFLDESVTPRFPDGLTVMQAEGRYRSQTEGLIEEPTRVLVILHDRADDKIDALTRDYIKRFDQESVLRSDSTARVNFITPTRETAGTPARLSK